MGEDRLSPDLHTQREKLRLADRLLAFAGITAGHSDRGLETRFDSAPLTHESAEPDLFSTGAGSEKRGDINEALEAKIQAIGKCGMERVWQLECRLLPVVQAMRQAGIGVDRERLRAYVQQHEQAAATIVGEIRPQFRSPVNLNSPKQLLAAFQAL